MHFPSIVLKELNPYYASLSNMCVIGISDIKDNPDIFDMNIYILNNPDYTEPFTITGVNRGSILNWYNDIAYLIDYIDEVIESYEETKNTDLEYITNGLRIMSVSLKRYWCIFICNDKTDEPALVGGYDFWLSDLAITTNVRNYITVITGKVFDHQLQKSLINDLQEYIGPYLLLNDKALIH